MAEHQTAPSGRGGENKKAPPRRNDVIRCENCGEDYSITYKRCPFCDERPGRGGGITGKRVANTRGGGYGGPIDPIQVVGLIVSVILIIAALVIVFKFIGGPLFGGRHNDGQHSSTSRSDFISGPGGNTSASGSGDLSQPPVVSPESIELNKTSVDLGYGEIFQMNATLSPEGAEGIVTWASSDPSVVSIDELGIVTNMNKSGTVASVIITASCGDVTAQCTVQCQPQDTGRPEVPDEPDEPDVPDTPDTPSTVGPNTRGTIVNAENGLNIRSGPGREYDVVASAQNGAKIDILAEENGWYKIRYIGSSTGYISKDYVSIDK